MPEVATPSIPRGKSRRKVRNFLLDAHLQLKFTLYAVAISVVVAALVGAVLWKTSERLFHEMERSVDARSQAASQSREVGTSALTIKLLARFDDPSFERVLRERSREIDQKYESESAAIVAERAELLRSQRLTTVALTVALLALVVLVGAAAIVTTHRIAGPLLRLRRMADDVGEGRLKVPSYGLRDHDELKDFFQNFSGMIQKLRDRENAELERISAALRPAEGSADPVAVLRELQVAKQGRLQV